jgi:hypothetical protein
VSRAAVARGSWPGRDADHPEELSKLNASLRACVALARGSQHPIPNNQLHKAWRFLFRRAIVIS